MVSFPLPLPVLARLSLPSLTGDPVHIDEWLLDCPVEPGNDTG
jgi:hypothetical protein